MFLFSKYQSADALKVSTLRWSKEDASIYFLWLEEVGGVGRWGGILFYQIKSTDGLHMERRKWVMAAASSPDKPILLDFSSQTALLSQWHGLPQTISRPPLLLFWALRLRRLWSPFTILSQKTELEISGILAGALKRFCETLPLFHLSLARHRWSLLHL